MQHSRTTIFVSLVLRLGDEAQMAQRVTHRNKGGGFAAPRQSAEKEAAIVSLTARLAGDVKAIVFLSQ